MDRVPERTKSSLIVRKVLHKIETVFPLPIKDPGFYQVIGLSLSCVFLWDIGDLFRILLLFVVVMLDWMDGATARRYNLSSKEGYVIDVVSDRIGEGLVPLAILDTVEGKVYFALYVINVALNLLTIKLNKHYSLALRPFFMFYLIVKLILTHYGIV